MGKFEAKKSPNNRKKRLWLLVSAEILVLVALIVGVVALASRNSLEGNWYDDGRLTYKFGSNGRGVMVLEDDLARFHYHVHGNRLDIDFDREDLSDRSYQFSIKGDTLILDDGSPEAPWTFTCG